MKKSLVLLIFMLLASLCLFAACAGATDPAPDPVPDPAAVSEPADVPEEQPLQDDPAAEAEDLAAQTELIAAASADWYHPGEEFFYTVTDLDGNGRLELIAATCQGTGLFTTAEVWEVSPDKSSLAKCGDNLVNDGDAYPDIIVDGPRDMYTDGETDYYIFTDVMRSGLAESSETVTSVCLKDGFVTVTWLYTMLINAEDGTIYMNDQTGTAASEEHFRNAAELVYGDTCRLQSVNFLWSRLDGDMPQQLAACRDAFLR